jgi:ABC-2 type transport system permease protein
MDKSSNSENPLHGLWALTNRELKKWLKNPWQFLLTIIQPIIWMALFGKAMNLGAVLTSISPPGISSQEISQLSQKALTKIFGTADYFSFMSVGILSFVVLFTTMFGGMSIVWDRRFGFLNKVLSTPVARGSIIMSKVFAAVIRSLLQAAIVLSVAYLLGLKLGPNFTPLKILGVFTALFLVSLGLASIFILIAIRSTRWETQMAVINLLNLPLLFASNTLFPTALMPNWLQAIAKVNPVTYANDATRQLIIYSTNMGQLIFDFIYLGAFAIIFTTMGIMLSWRYLSK